MNNLMKKEINPSFPKRNENYGIVLLIAALYFLGFLVNFYSPKYTFSLGFICILVSGVSFISSIFSELKYKKEILNYNSKIYDNKKSYETETENEIKKYLYFTLNKNK